MGVKNLYNFPTSLSRERKRCNVSLVIWTQVSRVAPRTFWWTLNPLSFRAAAKIQNLLSQKSFLFPTFSIFDLLLVFIFNCFRGSRFECHRFRTFFEPGSDRLGGIGIDKFLVYRKDLKLLYLRSIISLFHVLTRVNVVLDRHNKSIDVNVLLPIPRA